jgi:type II secretory pathway component PulF
MRDRSLTPMLAVTAILLFALVAVQMVYVVPPLGELLDGAGVTVSAPGRLAILASQSSILVALAWIGTIGAAIWWQRRSGGNTVARALAVLALLSALYLGCESAIFLSVAQVISRVH